MPDLLRRAASLRRDRRAAARAGFCALALAALAACASGPTPRTGTPSSPVAPVGPTTGGFRADAVDYANLSGWAQDSLDEALPALRRSCAVMKRKNPNATIGAGPLARRVADWQRACDAIPPAGNAAMVRAGLQNGFEPYRISATGGGSGLFTGYYEAELKGSLFPSPKYPYPVYGRPIDLVEKEQGGHKVVGRMQNGRVEPYPSRAEIEAGAIAKVAPVLFWTPDPVDLHIAQIQGSSCVDLPDGRRIRIGYAGNNGRPFKGLGRILLDAHLIDPGHSTMPDIRNWLHAYPRQAERLMQENTRYIFFRMVEGEGPVGAMGVPLTPMRSLAVDPEVLPLGAPVWLETADPDGFPIRRLVVAQDIGSAIKGAVRGDFFWGTGDTALAKAGRMKSPGSYVVLIPRTRPPHLATTAPAAVAD